MTPSNEQRADVLLTYGWVRSTYAALRNLHAHGLRVVVTDHHPVGMCQWSRYTTRFYRTVSPFGPVEVRGQTSGARHQPESSRAAQPGFDGHEEVPLYVRQIARIIEETGARVVIPSHDETELLARYRDYLPKGTLLPVASQELLAMANNKAEVQKFGESLGIPTPRRVQWCTLKDLPKALAAGLPSTKWVVRLRRSNSAKGVFYANGPAPTVQLVQELIARYQLPPERYPIIQEFVEGEGWGVSCLYWEGGLLASFTHRRLREKFTTGSPSTFREHQPNPVLEVMAHQLLSALKWHGLAMLEFKWSPERKRGWLIEINPRLWGSLHLSISAGVEFPYSLYLAASSGPKRALDFHKSCTVGYPRSSRWYLGDCISAVDHLRRGKLLQALKCILPSSADSCDDLNWRDPGAFLGEACYYGHQFLVSRSMNPAEEGMVG